MGRQCFRDGPADAIEWRSIEAVADSNRMRRTGATIAPRGARLRPQTLCSAQILRHACRCSKYPGPDQPPVPLASAERLGMLTPQLEIPSASAVGATDAFALGPPAAPPAGAESRRSVCCISSTASTTPAPSACRTCSPSSCRSSATKSASPASSRFASRSPARRRPPRWSSCRCAAASTCGS